MAVRMLGDSTVVDEMERSFYNALLGAMTPDGSNFTHINPFLSGNGWKRASGNQIAGFPDHDCCRAQGPYGLALAPCLALMKTENGYAVHLYENMEAPGILRIKGNYPSGSSVGIQLDRDGDFELVLRIPERFTCRVDGGKVPGGEYFRFLRGKVFSAGLLTIHENEIQ